MSAAEVQCGGDVVSQLGDVARSLTGTASPPEMPNRACPDATLRRNSEDASDEYGEERASHHGLLNGWFARDTFERHARRLSLAGGTLVLGPGGVVAAHDAGRSSPQGDRLLAAASANCKYSYFNSSI